MKRIPLLSTLALAAAMAFGTAVHAAQPTAADVGDADSFGKRVVWIGLAATGAVLLANDCTPDPANPLGPNDRCVVLNPSPATTAFAFADLGHISLPANSANTLICHWATPNIVYSYNNPGPAGMPVQFRARPTYRIESEVLNDPSLIDLATGLPFGGGLDVGISGVTELMTVAPGTSSTKTFTTTRTCIAGLVTRAALMTDHGLSDALAKKFFQKPITIRVGIAGAVRGVSDGSIFYSTRFTADEK